jgi:demethylmenaquinone methyltransferase / 2-methoxy-6-polyprenyl-1,4-benzoquinol methylase
MLMTTSLQSKEPVVRGLFGRIAPRYDLLNRIMTFGQDISWRKQAIRLLQIPNGARVLDAGAGTGDISLLIAKVHPSARIVAVDLTPEMVAVGTRRDTDKRIAWVIANAQHLPFAERTFDRVISGFLLRNVTNMLEAIMEQARVLVSEGRLVAMETTPPRKGWLRPVAIFHLRKVIPLMGRVIAGDAAAYLYLPKSIEDFVSGERMAELVEKVGFNAVEVRFRMMGTVSMVCAQRNSDKGKSLSKFPKKNRKSIKHR